MDNSNIMKIWGQRRRMLLTDTAEIDLVYVKKDTFCSSHRHNYKINRFIVVKGAVRIDTEYGSTILGENEVFEVRPPMKHRFYAIQDSTMVECAYVEEGKIDPNDIDRESQGGRIVQGQEMTLDEMAEKGLLEL